MKIVDNLLCHNNYSRPGVPLKKVKGIVVHYVANPNTSAVANRNFFNNRRDGKSGYGSAHYIIDLDGTIVRCIPENEMAYHVGAKQYKTKRLGDYPNDCTIGIECTHVDWNGKMTTDTYGALLELCSALCNQYELDAQKDLYLHYDITGKECHKWFLKNPREWQQFKALVASRGLVSHTAIELNGVVKIVDTINIEGNNYIKLRDLQCDEILVDYSNHKRMPIIRTLGQAKD
ncbi:MAG: N-acetylmuramoyl-L-alanine amidase family protein [Cellulosilyticaceae bacterium]